MVKETRRANSIVARLRENPLVALVIGFVAAIITLASFMDSARNLWGFVQEFLPSGDFVVKGSIVPESGTSVSKWIRITVVWAVDRPGDDTQFQDSRIHRLEPLTGRLNFKLIFDAPPPEEVLMNINGVKLGVGCIIAFEDKNENGIFDSHETLVAISSERAITYLKGDLRAVTEPEPDRQRKVWTLLNLPQGYSLSGVVPPEKHGLPVSFDDLIPVDSPTVNLIIYRNRRFMRWPNWK